MHLPPLPLSLDRRLHAELDDISPTENETDHERPKPASTTLRVGTLGERLQGGALWGFPLQRSGD